MLRLSEAAAPFDCTRLFRTERVPPAVPVHDGHRVAFVVVVVVVCLLAWGVALAALEATALAKCNLMVRTPTATAPMAACPSAGPHSSAGGVIGGH
jgi:hypothetical protein